MSKIKLNLTSGAVVEKPLINAFVANNFKYVVLDNEVNGSMGLPIILVCKLENNKLIKIVDPNEWQIVKEYLKNIIAGNSVEFTPVDSTLLADDLYYTQLTLPVPSFDALKKAYNIPVNSNVVEEKNLDEELSIMDMISPDVMNMSNNNINNNINNNVNSNVNNNGFKEVSSPSINPFSINESINKEPVLETPSNNMYNNNINTVNTPSNESIGINDIKFNNIDMPINPVNPVNPVSSVSSVNQVNTNNFEQNRMMPNEMPAAEVVNDTPVSPVNMVNENRFKDQKEAFMQACENMFEALVQKFEKELEKANK